jgi:DNA-directed RNA polymerase specialized sigma24 family protein
MGFPVNQKIFGHAFADSLKSLPEKYCTVLILRDVQQLGIC